MLVAKAIAQSKQSMHVIFQIEEEEKKTEYKE